MLQDSTFLIDIISSCESCKHFISDLSDGKLLSGAGTAVTCFVFRLIELRRMRKGKEPFKILPSKK
jgi:hypothetical protein